MHWYVARGDDFILGQVKHFFVKCFVHNCSSSESVEDGVSGDAAVEPSVNAVSAASEVSVIGVNAAREPISALERPGDGLPDQRELGVAEGALCSVA